MNYSQAQATQPRRPQRIATIPPNAFAESWADRPMEAIRVGLRTVSSDGDLAEARALADKRARERHPQTPEDSPVWVEAYNEELMGAALARAITSAESVDVPYWDLQDAVVPRVLTAQGKRALWLELEILTIQTSPLSHERSFGEAIALLEGRRDAFEALTVVERERVARLLGAAIEALGG